MAWHVQYVVQLFCIGNVADKYVAFLDAQEIRKMRGAGGKDGIFVDEVGQQSGAFQVS